LKLGTLCAKQIELLLAFLKCHLFQFFEPQAVYMTFYLQEQKIYMLPRRLILFTCMVPLVKGSWATTRLHDILFYCCSRPRWAGSHSFSSG
jgi:hypothetical protein